MKLLVQSSGKFLCVIWNLGRKTSKVRNVTFDSKKKKKKKKKNSIFFSTTRKIEKVQINSEKSINLFQIKMRIGHFIIYGTIFFLQFVNNFIMRSFIT